MDFWISQWISGFQLGFLDFWISVWISADGVRDFFRDGPLAGTSRKYSFHSSGKSVSGHCSQVTRLGFRVAPSAGPHLRQSLFSCSRPVFFTNHQLSKSCHLVRVRTACQCLGHVIRHKAGGSGL